MNTYEKQATDFLEKTGVTMSVEFKENGKHFEDDKDNRDIYTVKFKRGRRSFRVIFGQSIANSGTPPTAYDVLACLQKYEVGTFEDFCGEFGYDTDSKRSEKVYKAVVKEFDNVCKIWSDAEIEQLQEIN